VNNGPPTGNRWPWQRRPATLTPRRREENRGRDEGVRNLFYREGALDPKTAQLVALSAMAAAGCTS